MLRESAEVWLTAETRKIHGTRMDSFFKQRAKPRSFDEGVHPDTRHLPVPACGRQRPIINVRPGVRNRCKAVAAAPSCAAACSAQTCAGINADHRPHGGREVEPRIASEFFCVSVTLWSVPAVQTQPRKGPKKKSPPYQGGLPVGRVSA